MHPGRHIAFSATARFLVQALTLATLALLPMWPSYGAQTPSDSVPIIIAALQNLDDNDLDENWYFTLSLVQEKEKQIISSDPMKAKYERRQLLQVNGKVPDQNRLNKFRKEEIKRIDDIDPDTRGYSHLVDSRTLQFISQNEEVSEFSFRPRIKAMDGAEDKMRGTLLFNSNTNSIEKIEVRNTQELSPAFSVTVERYRLSFLFHAAQGTRLLRTMESHAVGKMGFLKRFDQLVVVNFSDFSRAPSTATRP